MEKHKQQPNKKKNYQNTCPVEFESLKAITLSSSEKRAIFHGVLAKAVNRPLQVSPILMLQSKES